METERGWSDENKGRGELAGLGWTGLSGALRAVGGEEMEEWLNGRTDCRLKMWWKDVGRKKGRMERSGVRNRGTYDGLRLS